MTVRPLLPIDLPVTLGWRNESREWFHDSGVIKWEEHLAWFEGLGADRMFIVEADGEPVAQFGLYDITDTDAEFGRLLVDPARRGEGFGRFAIVQAIWTAQTAGLKRLHLEVKADNQRARDLYLYAGYVETGTQAGIIRMEITL